MLQQSKYDKPHRLKGFDYSSVGSYMLTFHTAEEKSILSEVIPRSILEPPEVRLSPYGIVTEKHILHIPKAYPNVTLDNYVIMPTHVHLLLTVTSYVPPKRKDKPLIPGIIRATKAMISREIGESIWQLDFYDVVIQNEKKFLIYDQYIDDNPAVWLDKKGVEPEIP